MASYRGIDDTITEYENARAARLAEGRVLATSTGPQAPNTDAGAAYLLGYVAEAALKSAYFRVIQHGLQARIDHAMLKTAKVQAKALGVSTDPESYHSVKFWCDALIAQRAQRRMSFTSAFQALLQRNTDIIYNHWWVELRYKTPRTTPAERQDVEDAALWYDHNYIALYR
ncbi:MAG: hypothetical protein JNM72_01650 [Deltaproteobacteria bacterium]|jgi:hypothetical protein|nr:hypothetical protein [Deltaproteobacteria bacterium]